MSKNKVSLRDRYTQHEGRIHLRGSQAMVRLFMMQRMRDQAAGLNTAGFISGYRGSPMTAIDEEIWRVEDLLKEHHTHFWPGINENLAATAVWGSQQSNYYNDCKYDGVFSMWYGKGPGLDQCVDATRQGNWHGASKHGGVLMAVGDDPNMTSTINGYASELMFEDMFMPVLYPADIQEVLDMGLYGIALSRFCGAWTGYKLLPETIETSASIDADINRVQIITPEFEFPPEGVNSFLEDSVYVQEARIRNYRLPAALAFARANHLNYVSHSSLNPRLGIVTVGKSWRDAQQALVDLGISNEQAAELGISILKVGMPYPADKQCYADFAAGLEEVLVIEEKRDQLENGVRAACYHLPTDQRPRIVGRFDEHGNKLVDNARMIASDQIAQIIAQRIEHFHQSDWMNARVKRLQGVTERASSVPALNTARVPYFCSGCPHNTSTQVPEGSRGVGGVGCHYMATWMDRETYTFSQMGGEGVSWIGQAPFVKTDHVFQNLGDGTYFHSGSHAVRAAISSGTNITYKILFNDAVAMTGGQPVDGTLTVDQITRQMRNEGVQKIVVVTDEPEKYSSASNFARGTTVHHRRELDAVQRELREVKGVSVMVYDQTCASEKRRRRKRGTYPDPAKRTFINDRVCEGCGDCGVQSNCVSIQPLETDFGRKRKIDQSSCNKDFSCAYGFCPSFVTVLGGKVRKVAGEAKANDVTPDVGSLPMPQLPELPNNGSYGLLVTGVGGTGVVTIGALLGMAAHIDDIGICVVDQMGFAQKGGAVLTHVRFAHTQDQIHASRLNSAGANALLACDMLVAGGDNVLELLDASSTKAIVNTVKNYTGEFTRDTEIAYPADTLLSRLRTRTNPETSDFFDASALAIKLLGDTLGANLMLTGFAWQRGMIPVSEAALLQAIELNGVAVDWNKEAFAWGRRIAHQPELIAKFLQPDAAVQPLIFKPTKLGDWVQKFSKELSVYQDDAYAKRYRDFIDTVKTSEQQSLPGSEALSLAVAKAAHKLMAYKDEYEVARLYSEPEFKQKLQAQFEGDYTLEFNLAPPIISPTDKKTGAPTKMQFGPWMLTAFGWLAKLKFLRGSRFDPFGYLPERKVERELIDKYFSTINALLSELNSDNLQLAVAIAEVPMSIRGYGHIKDGNVEKAHAKLQELLAQWPGEAKQIAA
ncbi:MAG: indolepyruvate ferredoxin oxidoreductase family protein [Pseudomonadales bacterium]